MELAHSLEQLPAGGVRQLLCGEHEGHLFSAIGEPREDLERLVRRAGASDAVSARVSAAQLPLDVAQQRRLGVDGHEQWAHAEIVISLP